MAVLFRSQRRPVHKKLSEISVCAREIDVGSAFTAYTIFLGMCTRTYVQARQGASTILQAF